MAALNAPLDSADSKLNLRSLVNELSSVKNKWFILGVQLKIDPATLKAIEMDYHGCERCLLEMLEHWLKGNAGTPSWRSIVEALRSLSVLEVSLAARIEAQYCSSACKQSDLQDHNQGRNASETQSDIDSASTGGAAMASPSVVSEESTEIDVHPSATVAEPSTSSFPLLKEHTSHLSQEDREPKIQLRLQTQGIMKKYCYLLTAFCQSLCDNEVSVEELVRFLRELRAYDPVEDVSQEQQKSLMDEHMHQLKNAKSIDDIFDVIEKYCTFFNYEILEDMIDKYGTENDKLILQEYKKDFNNYTERRIYECSSKIVKEGKSNGTPIRMKLDSRYDRYSLKTLQNFRVSLSKILKVSGKSLILCQIDEGRVEVTFQIPTFVQIAIFPLSADQEKDLKDLGVLFLSSGAYSFPTEYDQGFKETVAGDTSTNIYDAFANIIQRCQEVESGKPDEKSDKVVGLGQAGGTVTREPKSSMVSGSPSSSHDLNQAPQHQTNSKLKFAVILCSITLLPIILGVPLNYYIDADKCTLLPAPLKKCEHHCNSTTFWFKCNCDTGYRLDSSNKWSCDDIDECEEKTHKCQHLCTNTEGSYACRCYPNRHFYLTEDGHHCESWLSYLKSYPEMMKEHWFQGEWNNITGLDILLTGKTGSGKSTLINGLLGKKVIQTKENLLSKDTRSVTSYTLKVHGVEVKIWDSPGLQDRFEREHQYIAEMKSKCHSIDLVFYCIKMDESRLYADDKEAVMKLTKAFGKKFWKNTFFILTFANKIEPPGRRKHEPKEYFIERLNAWTDMLFKELLMNAGVTTYIDEQTLRKRVIPAGFEDPHLPDRKYWLSKLWHNVLEEAKEKAQGAMLKLGLERMINETMAEKFAFSEHDLDEQPIVSDGTWWQALQEWALSILSID